MEDTLVMTLCPSSHTHFFHDYENLHHICMWTGVSTRPRVSAVVTEHSVVIEWTPSQGLLAVANYTVLVYQEEEEEGDNELVDTFNITAGAENNTVVEGLKSFSQYAVEVVAINIAGNRTSSELVNFSTLETGEYIHIFCRATIVLLP